MPLLLPNARAEHAWTQAAELYALGVASPALSVPAPVLINAKVVSVHDGDTINVVANPYKDQYVGSLAHPQPIRLLGCNAEELTHKAPDGSLPGQAARDAVMALLPPGTDVVLSAVEDDKYAPRWDASVSFVYKSLVVDLVALLIAQQWVAPWNGKGSPPVPVWPRTLAA